MDVAACTDRGVLLWSNTGAHGENNATAEQTVALILAALRQRSQQMASATAGNWQTGVGRRLRGRTLGLCGCGRIGRAVAGYACAPGAPIHMVSPSVCRR